MDQMGSGGQKEKELIMGGWKRIKKKAKTKRKK